jgi:hypothetical protein
MPALTLSTAFVARADLLACDVGDDGVVLLDPRAGIYLGLEGPAQMMWAQLSQGPVSLGALCASVVEAYEVTPDICEADARAFIADLLCRDLVTVVDGDVVRHEP